jgi:D-glucosaminate-6-phosphate ammonia-lyase
MRMADTRDLYEEMGIKRVINARGSVTILGGSILSPSVQAAMATANAYYVDMEELLDTSGRAVAALLGAEAALVTSGCFAALVQGAAAIMAGKNPERIARLPDTTGMRHEFLFQKPMRYHYDRCVSVPGGRLVEVGGEHGATAEQLEAAIGPRTAGILYLAKMEGTDGIPSIPDVARIARKKGVAMLVDAAAEVYPLQRMTWLVTTSGADLVCFGGKYFGSVQSTGLLCGRKDLVEAAAANGFIAYETLDNRALGRGYKVDRQEIIATLVALREWFATDHEERLALQARRTETIAQGLTGLPHVKAERVWERKGPWMMLRVTVDEAKLGKPVASIETALRDGEPSIRIRVEDGQIALAVHTLQDGEDRIVAERLRQVLSG